MGALSSSQICKWTKIRKRMERKERKGGSKGGEERERLVD